MDQYKSFDLKGRYRLNHRFATHLASIGCSSETIKGRGGGDKSIYIMKAPFKTNLEINVPIFLHNFQICRIDYSRQIFDICHGSQVVFS